MGFLTNQNFGHRPLAYRPQTNQGFQNYGHRPLAYQPQPYYQQHNQGFQNFGLNLDGYNGYGYNVANRDLEYSYNHKTGQYSINYDDQYDNSLKRNDLIMGGITAATILGGLLIATRGLRNS